MGRSCSELTRVWPGSSGGVLRAGRSDPILMGLFGKGMFSGTYRRRRGWAELGRPPRSFGGQGWSVSLSPHLGFHGCKMNAAIHVSWGRGGEGGQFFLTCEVL